MKKTVALGVALLLVGLGVSGVVIARPPARRGGGDRQLHKLADDVYVYRGVFSASGVLILPTAVLVVDTQVAPLAAERLKEQVARVTGLPIKYVVNTHYHGDHTGGNGSFPGAEIIATDLTAQYIRERDGERVEYANTFGLAFQRVHATVPPTRTFTGKLDLDIGGEHLEILQLGRTETPDACVVWWPSRRVIVTGDGVSTLDYPWTGVPFLDEGLQPDGEWIGFLQKVKALHPTLLIPGHGPPIEGEGAIAERLDLLAGLFTDLFAAVKPEVEAGKPAQEIELEVNEKLRRYREREDMKEKVTSQPFAIYKAINGLTPSRRGRGWWSDLRPSVIRRASPETAAEEIQGKDSATVRARAIYLAAANQRPLAIAMLETWTAQHPTDAPAWAVLSDVLLDGMAEVLGKMPAVDATEYFAAAIRAARSALAINPREQLALLTLGAAEVWGGMVLAQPMEPAIAKLNESMATGGLTDWQLRKASFFLGKAYQMEDRDAESDSWYRAALPGWARLFYPVVRERLRAL